MHYLLAKRHVATLAHFASSNVVVAFDYDGTLAPTTGDPARARLRRRTRRLLGALALRYPCVVISGRCHDDVSMRLAGIPVWYVFGNHGAEPCSPDAVYANRVRRWADHLRRRLPTEPGLVVENKTYSLAIHYRHVRRKGDVVPLIHQAVAGLPGSRVIGGNQAINLLPREAPHKGTALERARRHLACDCAVYVGDDDTDEDAFAAAPPERLLAVRIGPSRATRAAYYLRTQSEVDSLLNTLIRLRSSRSRWPD
jgi:trehalose 6-phosphate phosphatase